MKRQTSKLVWIICGIFLLWLIYSTGNQQKSTFTPQFLTPVHSEEEFLTLPKKDPNYVIPKLIRPGEIITPEEADEIIRKSSWEMKDSQLLGKEKVNYIHRKSKTRWIPKTDPLGKKIILRAVQWIKKNDGIDIPVANAERIQVVRYGPGNFYNPHHDACAMDKDTCKKFKKRGGERIRTVILGLNEGDKNYTGGYTSFPNLGVKYRLPRAGGLMFHTLDRQGVRPHPHALHGGDKIGRGVKWICNIWFRESEFI